MQIKRWLKILGAGMVKNGCGQSFDGTLKLTVSEEWTMNWLNKPIFCILIQIHKNQKLIRNLLGGHGQKCVWIVWSWDSKIDCISDGIQSNLYKTTTIGTTQKGSSWTGDRLIKHLYKTTTNQMWSFLAGF